MFIFDETDKKNFTIMFLTASFSLEVYNKKKSFSVFKDHKMFHHIQYYGIFWDMDREVKGSLFIWNAEDTRFVCIDIFTVTLNMNEKTQMMIFQNKAKGQLELYDVWAQPNFVFKVSKGYFAGIMQAKEANVTYYVVNMRGMWYSEAEDSSIGVSHLL